MTLPRRLRRRWSGGIRMSSGMPGSPPPRHRTRHGRCTRRPNAEAAGRRGKRARRCGAGVAGADAGRKNLAPGGADRVRLAGCAGRPAEDRRGNSRDRGRTRRRRFPGRAGGGSRRSAVRRRQSGAQARYRARDRAAPRHREVRTPLPRSEMLGETARNRPRPRRSRSLMAAGESGGKPG